MSSTILLSDNGATSGISGYQLTGGTDGTLTIQTTTSGGTPTTAVSIDNTQNTTVAGNLTLSGTGKRITGDFSNATVANRVAFQTSTANSNTALTVLPNGTATTSTLLQFNNSDPTNAGYGGIQVTSGIVNFLSGITGTGTYLPMTFYTGGSERMRVDTSGNVGIGTSSPAVKLHVSGGFRVADSTNSANYISIGSGNDAPIGNNSVVAQTGSLVVGTVAASTVLQLATVGSERARIDSSGNLLVGTTSAKGKFTCQGVSEVASLVSTSSTGNCYQVFYKNSGSTSLGYIGYGSGSNDYLTLQSYVDRVQVVAVSNGVYVASGGTSWTSLSDERHKDIIEPIADATNKVSTLRAVIGKYKTDAEGTRRSFLIAQDVQAVLPEAVDASDPENLGVQYTDTIPLLVKAIQEQQAIITQQAEAIASLQADVAELKGK